MNATVDLVLASTSPYRRELMGRLGLPFRCQAPRVDEDQLKEGLGPLAPGALAERLAEAKARSLIDVEPRAVLIGCDQVAAFQGRVFGKPGSIENAVEQLLTMSGKSHQLITALFVWHEGNTHRHTDVTTLHFRPLGRSEIERHVAADRPLDCAGGYKIESRGITLFEKIETQDHTAIIGLPLIALTNILRTLVPSLF